MWDQDINIDIFNLNGQIVYSKQYRNQEKIFENISIPGNGIYFVKILGETFLETKKLIIQ